MCFYPRRALPASTTHTLCFLALSVPQPCHRTARRDDALAYAKESLSYTAKNGRTAPAPAPLPPRSRALFNIQTRIFHTVSFFFFSHDYPPSKSSRRWDTSSNKETTTEQQRNSKRAQAKERRHPTHTHTHTQNMHHHDFFVVGWCSQSASICPSDRFVVASLLSSAHNILSHLSAKLDLSLSSACRDKTYTDCIDRRYNTRPLVVQRSRTNTASPLTPGCKRHRSADPNTSDNAFNQRGTPHGGKPGVFQSRLPHQGSPGKHRRLEAHTIFLKFPSIF